MISSFCKLLTGKPLIALDFKGLTWGKISTSKSPTVTRTGRGNGKKMRTTKHGSSFSMNMSTNNVHICPTCGSEHDTDFGLKQHHVKSHGESLAFKQCKNCDEEFKPHNLDNDYCSRECYREDTDFTGESNPRWSDAVEKPCDHCGEMLELKPWELESKENNFCSNKCKYEFMRGPGVRLYNVFLDAVTECCWPTFRDENINDECLVCGSTDRLELHHAVPIMAGGPSCDANLVTLCSTHHRKTESIFGSIFDRVLDPEVINNE